MIEYTVGDLFKSDADCLVNAVNCEGVMGKGIAYQFKIKFPSMYADYVKVCKQEELTIGRVHYFKENNKVIINLPTKDKWRNKSQIEYVSQGLDAMIVLLPHLNVHKVAIPALGCGLGGLSWDEVKSLIEHKLNPIQDMYRFVIYEPKQ